MFSKVHALRKKVASFNQQKVMREIMNDPIIKAQVLDMNREQLLSGHGADGEDLPRYVDDPYFKSKESAERYRDWKRNISPNSDKDPEVMDFFITGLFHNTIQVKAASEGIQLYSTSPIIKDVQQKTNDNALGITRENKIELLPEIRERFLDDFKATLKK
jgi:hypothetical protein